jgi:hypothetical protein
MILILQFHLLDIYIIVKIHNEHFERKIKLIFQCGRGRLEVDCGGFGKTNTGPPLDESYSGVGASWGSILKLNDGFS